MPVTSTIKPAGGGDYADLATWESAKDGDADKAQTADCYSGGDLGKVTFAGWTATTTTAHPIVKAADGEGHDGDKDTGANIQVGSGNGITFDTSPRFAEIRGLRIDLTGSGTNGVNHTAGSTSGGTTLNGLLIVSQNCSGTKYGIRIDKSATNVFTIQKCIVTVDTAATLTKGMWITAQVAGGTQTWTLDFYNNSVYGATTGVEFEGIPSFGTQTFKLTANNNVIFPGYVKTNFGAGVTFSVQDGTCCNATGDTTADTILGTSITNLTSQTASLVFVSATSGDLHLVHAEGPGDAFQISTVARKAQALNGLFREDSAANFYNYRAWDMGALSTFLGAISTIKPAGGGDYADLATWEAAVDGVSPLGHAECYIGDVGQVTLSGWSNEGDNLDYVQIYAADDETNLDAQYSGPDSPRNHHRGKYVNPYAGDPPPIHGAYIDVVNSPYKGVAVEDSLAHVSIRDLRIDMSVDSVSTWGIYVGDSVNLPSSGARPIGGVIDNCMITYSGTGGTARGIQFEVEDWDVLGFHIRRNFIFSLSDDALDKGIYMNLQGLTDPEIISSAIKWQLTGQIFCNTVIANTPFEFENASGGAWSSIITFTLKNNIAMSANAGAAFVKTQTALNIVLGGSNNLSSDGSADSVIGGAGNVINVTPGETFKNVNLHDYHLKQYTTASAAVNGGANINGLWDYSASPGGQTGERFFIDMELTAFDIDFGTDWDIGCFASDVPTVSTIKPGGGGDYADLSTWESAVDGLAAGQWAECYTGGDLGTVALIGWNAVPDKARHGRIFAADGNRHNGNVWGGARIDGGATMKFRAFAPSSPWNTVMHRFLELDGLRITIDAASETRCIEWETNAYGGIIENCLCNSVFNNTTATLLNWKAGNTLSLGTEANIIIRNNLVVGNYGNFDRGSVGLAAQVGGTNRTGTFNAQIYNNTVAGRFDSTAFRLAWTKAGSGTVKGVAIVKNNLILSHAAPTSGDIILLTTGATLTLLRSNNETSDDNADTVLGGSNNVINASYLTEFQNEVSNNYKLANSADAIDAGVFDDGIKFLFIQDIINKDYLITAWDIGAYAAARIAEAFADRRTGQISMGNNTSIY